MTTSTSVAIEPQSTVEDRPPAIEGLIAEFLEPFRGRGSFWGYSSAARHFAFWLERRRIPLASVDAALVDRFMRHRCRCPRYSAAGPGRAEYLSRVRRFVCFLEDHGRPAVDDPSVTADYLASYSDHLIAIGYSRCAWRVYRSAAEHFARWLRSSRIGWRDVDADVVERFARHECRCALCRKRAPLEASGAVDRRRGAHRFWAFLQGSGAIAVVHGDAGVEDPRLRAFRLWLQQHCGATRQSIVRYLAEASRWLSDLGDDPAAFDAALIREVVLNQGPLRARASVRLTATVLRGYLRFLAAHGKCRPELIHAVPSVARRSVIPLPRYVGPATIERIVASCDAATSASLRDRAIILLLARLGLRAGDICQLRLADIDWSNALLHVQGKGRRAARMPLPQDAGDALLAYIERARPMAREERVFLRVLAPFTPFASSAQIAGILARVLARSGIGDIPTGAHMFRHSLATGMLRKGASLEAVGAVLRHRSPETTAIYAKVDVAMLARVAQPWPGDA
jgi:site-specific recombinase XerD